MTGQQNPRQTISQSWRIEHGNCITVMAAMPEASVDAIVCDPPYGLAFMGNAWDTYSARLFQEWCEKWAREALRVLKPGGHLLAFGGTRTYHRLTCGIEDAGFEIRDAVQWLYGSGFPKSLDVSKAIDKLDAAAERDTRAKRSQTWLRQHVTPKQVNEATTTDMGHHLTTHPTQPAVPTAAMLDQLRPLLPAVPEWLEDLVRDRAVESENFKAREVIAEAEMVDTSKARLGFAGETHSGEHANAKRVVAITTAHTPDAETWQGWGTALKPAHEPVAVARKPFPGTVAANVLAHGTAAINVDECRIEGRWPANVALDDTAAAMLDKQTGTLKSGSEGPNGLIRNGDKFRTAYGEFAGTEREQGKLYGDEGGASRFFYCAKADTDERNAGLATFTLFTPTDAPDRNDHPTVKPIDVMRWLVRMVTPPGGTVLDPFTGSGSTGCATVLEGFHFIGIEQEAEYVSIARARLAHWSAGITEEAA